jgi:hypothetical protein
MALSSWSQTPKLNPLNYSGRMYISSVEAISTPRYVSYEDHAILSTELSVPVVEVSKVEFDFKNNVILIQDKSTAITNVRIKEHTDEYSRIIVIYMDLVDSTDKMELVWPDDDSPYLLQITPDDDKVAICKMKLSQKPVASSGEDALMQLLNSLGGM